jgi:hypothetical protein
MDAQQGNFTVVLNAARVYKRRAGVFLVATACVVSAWLLAAITGQAEDATVTIAIASTPALERIRPMTGLARVTLTA